MAALLPDAHGALPLAAEVTHVRLLSLRSWSYASVEPLQTFAQTLKQLSVGPLQLPWREAADLAPSALTPLVRSALAKGYTALDHRGFDGQTTLAWYRGPFLPSAGAAAKAAPVIQVGTPISRATDLLCVDADSGLVDASYAAAWQLGQLLALRDQGFATALVRWKHANTLVAAAALERAVLENCDTVDNRVGRRQPSARYKCDQQDEQAQHPILLDQRAVSHRNSRMANPRPLEA